MVLAEIRVPACCLPFVNSTGPFQNVHTSVVCCAGWSKAISVWTMVMALAAGARHVIMELFLGDALPGEEIVDTEIAFAFLWRLVPFWLNKWERDWGAEVSSVLFAAPHIAAELLVLQPLLQVRLRVCVCHVPHAHSCSETIGVACCI